MNGVGVRPWRADRDEFAELFRLNRLAFGNDFSPAIRRIGESLFEPGRALLAEVDDGAGKVLAGKVEAYSLEMAVPGRTVLPTAGLTWVAVLPTHRGRGLFTALVQRHLADLHERGDGTAADASPPGGEALSILYASRAGGYHRFGYGLATRHLRMTIPAGACLHPEAERDPALSLLLGTYAELNEPAEQLYARLVPERPGMLARRGSLRELATPETGSGGAEARCILVTDDRGPRAFARFLVQSGWSNGSPRNTITVIEAHSVDAAAARMLWRFFLEHDTSAAVHAANIAVDDPLLHWLADTRRPQPTLVDGLYLRVVDIGRALAARRYFADVDLVLEVSDPVCPWNTGRWRLLGGPDGASCDRTGKPADLRLSAAELGAIYLGGTTIDDLARAGRIREQRPGRAKSASGAFGSPVAPWSAFSF
ncbi:GNAT family N-acetyltransferase [Nocardia terpenica]|uniref:GNAT family N-acetyltransferase n=1 Tax=Nocardia terpenica TaxID=455432 RepID=A0A6G9Z8F5_9NOCA|nr:GNAT family N-acetyltransferase [Nocardia terpenica]QIS21637.1 GNAT family N-acetyltransferase [Nocardia terpenica]